MTKALRRVLVVSALLSSPLAHAQPGTPAPAAPPPAPLPVLVPEDAAETPPLLLDTQSQLEDLRQKMYDLEQQLEQTRQVATLRRPIVNVNGYVDFGFFVPEGNGAGIVAGLGPDAARFPQYANQYGWVFLGDLLAPAVNSRGEVADLGDSPGVDRFDSIHSNGAPGFIVNEVNLTLTAALAHERAGHRQRELRPPHRLDFSARRLHRRRLWPARVDADRSRSARRSSSGKFDSVSASSTASARPTSASASRRR